MMKNKLTLMLAGSVFLFSVLGCSSLNPFGGTKTTETAKGAKDKSLTDKAVDTAVGDEKIGVVECDEVVDYFNTELNNAEDDFVTKAVKATILNKMKESFKKSLEDNKSDKAELAKTCKDFKAQLEKYKAEEESKK